MEPGGDQVDSFPPMRKGSRRAPFFSPGFPRAFGASASALRTALRKGLPWASGPEPPGASAGRRSYANVIRGGRPECGSRGAWMALGRTGWAVAGFAGVKGIPTPPRRHNGPDDIGIFARHPLPECSVRPALAHARFRFLCRPRFPCQVTFGAACRGGTAVSAGS